MPSFDEFLVVPERESLIFGDFLDWQGEILTVDEIEWINHLTNSTLANHSFHHFAASELSIDNFTLNVDLNQKNWQDINHLRITLLSLLEDQR